MIPSLAQGHLFMGNTIDDIYLRTNHLFMENIVYDTKFSTRPLIYGQYCICKHNAYFSIIDKM